MEFVSRRAWRANVKITVFDLAGRVLDVQELKNLLMTDGFNMVRDGFAGDVVDFQIKRMAIGDDDTPPAIDQSDLLNETERFAITSDSKPADGQYKSVWYIAPDEGVGAIEEVGWFAGAAAGPGAGTGIMISRILYSRNKTNLESIQFERTETIEEG